MSVNGINGIISNVWYGQDVSSTDSDPLLEVNSKKKTDLYSALNAGTSSMLDDSVDLSQTASFFSKLQQLESSDPEKFKEVAKGLAERLKNAKGSEQYVFADLAQQVADGGDISDVILNKASGASTGSSSGTLASQVKQFLTEVMASMESDE
jgi:hypothetical protein